MKNTINNAIGLLEECLENGERGSLYAWFAKEEALIKRTLSELNGLENEQADPADEITLGEILQCPRCQKTGKAKIFRR